MKIDVSGLRKAPGETIHHEFNEDLAPFENDSYQVSFAEPVFVSLDITNTGMSLQAKGAITAELLLNCCRCLEIYRHHLEMTFEEQYRHISEVENSDCDDDQNYQVYEGDCIDFTDAVRENVIIGIPMKPVCSSDCRGICAICGTNKNIKDCGCKNADLDPRLAALKDFFK